jgi:hypothetical protein
MPAPAISIPPALAAAAAELPAAPEGLPALPLRPAPIAPPAEPAAYTAGEPAAGAPAPPEPAPAALPDERERIRAVLSRYEAAYTRLDARAAHAVWPGVDRGALARAFSALESQRLHLGNCDVAVDGGSARAECAGTATWTPKVGSGRTESRRWAFDLKNASGAWQIVGADIR